MREKKKMKLRCSAGKITAVVLAAVIIAYGAYYGYQKISRPANGSASAVNVSLAVRGNIETTITGKGTLNPRNQYEVRSLVKGKILQAPVEEGESVKKGDLLYKISTGEVENGIRTAKLALERAEQAYHNTVEQKEDLNITAPVSGYIKKLMVKPGDAVQSGTAAAEIYDSDKMLIIIPFLSEQVSGRLAGKKAVLVIDGTGERIDGIVSSVSNMEEVADGGILIKKVTIEVKNPGGLRDGDYAEGSIGTLAGIRAGTFRAAVETSAAAGSSGTLHTLSVKEGDYVTAGSIIGRISSRELDERIESSRMGAEEARLALEALEGQLDNYKLKAPISGKVIVKNVKKGDTIDPSSSAAEPMAIIYDLSVLTFRLDVDELDIGSIRKGQKVLVSAGACPEETFEGKVENISLKSTTNNGVTSYPVTVKLDTYGKLLPGMNVTATIVTGRAENVITIPSEALIRQNTVYVEDNGQAEESEKDPSIPKGFKEVYIKTGLNNGAVIEAVEGLEEGSRVYVPAVDTAGGFGDMYSGADDEYAGGM